MYSVVSITEVGILQNGVAIHSCQEVIKAVVEGQSLDSLKRPKESLSEASWKSPNCQTTLLGMWKVVMNIPGIYTPLCP